MSYSTNLAERFLGQFTDLITNSNGVRQYADKLINDHAQTAVKQGRYAAATGTYLPASAQGSDVSTALKVVGAVNTRGRSTKYDRVYLQAMVRSHSADIQTNQNVVATIQNPVLKEFAMEDIPTDYLHRQGAQTLLRSNRR
jgi:predicted outer membrane protein